MALFGEFSHTYPTQITLSSEWCDVSQSVEYDSQIENALGEFQNEARALCPIRTGNLVSSISGTATGDGFTAEATADYAEYVEYGTWKMSAQPYFVETFQMAGEACGEIIQTHLQEVLAEAQAIARLEIDEHYTMEKEIAYEEFRDGMAGGVDVATFMALMAELEQRLHELALKYAECVEQIETQIEEYQSQGTFEISIA